MSKKPSTRLEQIRRTIAMEAARLMSEHGIDDYGLAKRKAALRMGMTDTAALPRNTEIEAALIEHQRLFTVGHADTLAAQRRAAWRAMQLLSEFQPRLVGPVLTGTATAHSDIDLHLFTDQPETVALKLLDHGIAHQITDRRVKMDAERTLTCPAVRFAADDQTIDAVVFPLDGLRQAPYSPVDGRPMRRANRNEVKSLLDQGP